MGRNVHRNESGQTSSEYSLVLGAIALVCIAAAVFVGIAIKNHFGSSNEQIGQAPFVPPKSTPAPVWPTAIAQCEDGGWRAFPQFSDEEECRDYVEGLSP